MKHLLMAGAAGLLLTLAGCAQPDRMQGMRPGMMGDDEVYGGLGMGPGMMHGGAAAHHGRGAHGMAAHRMGGAMMGDYGAIPDLTDAQRAQIAQIHQDLHRKQWALMGQMHEQAWQMPGRAGSPFDEQAARQAYDQRAALRKQMFENSLEARRRISSVLTPQQRDALGRRPGGQ